MIGALSVLRRRRKQEHVYVGAASLCVWNRPSMKTPTNKVLGEYVCYCIIKYGGNMCEVVNDSRFWNFRKTVRYLC